MDTRKNGAANWAVNFLVGFLGGIAALMLILFIEGFLALLSPVFFTLRGFVLLVPAFIEELVKIIVSKKLGERYGFLGIVLGVGVGVGMVESLIAQEGVSGGLFAGKFLYLQPFFLLAGYAAARFIAPKKDNVFLVFWVVFSTFLHWAYNSLWLNF